MMDVGQAVTRSMQDQKYKDEGKLISWNYAYWMERMMRVLIRLERHEEELRRYE